MAFARLVVEVAAGAGIHGRRQHEARREAERHGGARDGDRAVFERLAHHLEHVARKLRQLVQKEHAVVRQRNFAGARNDAAADQPGVGDGVVRRAERALRHQPGRGIEHAGDGMNLGGLERLFKGERRAGSMAGAWPAWSCRSPAARSSGCCGRRLRPLPVRAWRCADRAHP